MWPGRFKTMGMGIRDSGSGLNSSSCIDKSTFYFIVLDCLILNQLFEIH